MNDHALRFVRSLALGLAATALATTSCTPSESTTTTRSSTGGEQTATVDASARASVVPGAPCAMGSAEVATTHPSLPPGTMCLCHNDNGSASAGTYLCPVMLVGPLAPPELAV